MVMVTLFDPRFRIPRIVLELAEEFIIHHHFGGAVILVLEMNESAVPEFLTPLRHFFGDDVGVDVNLMHEGKVGRKLEVRGRGIAFAAPLTWTSENQKVIFKFQESSRGLA